MELLKGVALGILVILIVLIANSGRKQRDEIRRRKSLIEISLLTDAIRWIKEEINIEYKYEGTLGKKKIDSLHTYFLHYHPKVNISIDWTDEKTISISLTCGNHFDVIIAPIDIPKDHLIHDKVFRI